MNAVTIEFRPGLRATVDQDFTWTVDRPPEIAPETDGVFGSWERYLNASYGFRSDVGTLLWSSDLPYAPNPVLQVAQLAIRREGGEILTVVKTGDADRAGTRF